MKKFAKILALLLVVAALAGALVFSVAADDTPAEEPAASTVGQYTAPEGAWTPADDTVYFAVWATEAEYLAGNDPVTVGTTDEIAEAHVGAKSDEALTFYIVMFKDCKTQNSQLTTGKNTKVVFNLAGHTLDCTNGFKVGNYSGTPTTAELTLKNGTFNHKSGNMQLRRFSKLFVENIVYNVGGACLDYDDNAALIEYRDSILNITGGASFMIATNKGVAPCQINFINTDVITTNTAGALFTINANGSTSTTEEIVNIRFDKDSSITRDAAVPLVAINRSFGTPNDTNYYLSAPQCLIFEAGCVLSENIAPVCGQGYSYFVSHYNQSSGYWGPNNDKDTSEGRYIVTYDGAFAHGEFAMKVVEPGTNQVIEWTNEAVAGGVKLVAKASEGTAWTPDAEHAGIAYGVWETEAAFLAGEAPKYWSATATVNTDQIGTTDGSGTTYGQEFVPGYVRLYTDVTSVAGSQGQIITGGEQQLTIDLNGFTYIDKKGFRVGGSSGSHPDASLTIKNGVYLRKDGQFHLRQNVDMIFDKVSLIINTDVYDPAVSAGAFENKSMFYGPAADLIMFKDSSILILNGQNLGNLNYHNAGETVQKIIFENTDIEYGRYAPYRSLFRFTNNTYQKSCIFDIYFDENSSIIGDFTNVGLVSIVEGIEEGNRFDINVYTELGFKFSDKAAPSFNCDFTAFDGVTEKVASSTADGAIFTWTIVNPDTTEEAVGAEKLAVTTGHYYNMSTYTGDVDAEYAKLYQFVELDAEGNIIKTWPVGTVLGFDSAANKAPFKTTNGSTIKFYNDTVISYTGTYQDYSVTFDLNGCTLYFTGTERFQIGHSMSGNWMERKVSFINSNPDKRGILDFTQWTNGNNYVFQNRPGSIITFSDIDMLLKNSLFTEYGAKSITFKNVNFINASGNQQYLIAGGYDSTTSIKYTDAGNVREIVFDNCVFDEQIYAARWTHTTYKSGDDDVNYNDKIKVTVKNGTVLANGYAAPFTVAGIGVQSVEFDIADDTKFTSLGAEICRLEKGVATIDLNGYAPKAIRPVYATEEVEGETVKTLLYYETFNATNADAPVSGDLQANLTLFTDFKVNFYLKGEALAMYNLNGSAMESEVYEGKTKYTARFNAHEAADSQAFLVEVNKGEDTYYLVLNYSVAKYATALNSAEVSVDSKKLLSAAMTYVSAAYEYAGKTAPSFAGYAYDEVECDEAPESNLTSAISGVQLNLDSGFKLRFNIAEGYTGTLVVNGVSYEVIDGAYNDITYVNVELRAFELYDAVIEIAAGDETGAYSLANYYVFAMESEDDALISLAYYLYNYCYYANQYVANHPAHD